MTYRTALITGASSGIGRALALEIASHGVEVALVARRRELLDDLAAEIVAAKGRARVYELDVADVHQVRTVLREADDAMGGIDLVVANAGVGQECWSGKLKWEHCEKTIQVNVHGAVATLIALVDRMVERKSGHLVGVSSLAQYRGLPRNAIYSASKAFFSTFMESMRIDLRQSGVAVTDIRPGFVRTPMTAANKHPMPWLMDAEDAARTVWNGIEKKNPVVAFPWQLATLVRGASVLPAAAYDRAIAKGARK